MTAATALAPAAAQTATTHAPHHADQPLALYVHWPFCVSKCPYCDFNSHVRDTIDQARWRDALLRDLAHEAEQLPGSTLASIFFGGGTPSLMPPGTVATIIDAATRHWPTSDDIEITLEANPSSVEAARFAALLRAGVNRLSLGVQAFDDEVLRFLGRAHDSGEALAALDVAQRTFPRVSFDLIYALPGQSIADWRRDLVRALGLGTGHLSLYQLTIEPGTRFAALAAKGELTPMPSDDASAFYKLTQEVTSSAGLPAYETSNHARAGEESRHNLAYWRYQSYSGIGPGAHGRRGDRMTQRHRKPENWLSAIARNGHGIAEESALDGPTRGMEALLMGLRLVEGVDLESIARIANTPVKEMIDTAAVSRLERLDLLRLDGPRLRTTGAGSLLLDAILGEIVKLPG